VVPAEVGLLDERLYRRQQQVPDDERYAEAQQPLELRTMVMISLCWSFLTCQSLVSNGRIV
jgi:hypothetical protein